MALPIKLALWSKFRGNDLLRGIPPETLAKFEQHIEEMFCEPEQIIFDEDEPGESLYLIGQGSVRISKKGRGGLQETLTHLEAGDFFGEMALLDMGRRSAQASAVGKTLLGRVDRRAWDTLLQLAPQAVMVNFSHSITRRLRHNNQHFIEQMMLSERLSLLGTTISSIIHDMSSPITCIIGACEYMQNKVQDAAALEMTTIIQKSVERMEAMTEELMDFTRGTTNLSLQSIPIALLVYELEEMELQKCLAKKIHFEKQINYKGRVNVDSHRILRLLSNLIKNAREAMPRGGQLKLMVEQQGDFVLFRLSDTGCGIPPEILAKMFEPFVTHGKSAGTGLGLAIAKSVVEAHHGSISVTSAVNRGTTFEVRIPADLGR